MGPKSAPAGTWSVSNLPYEIICPDTTAISRPEWLKLRQQGLGGSDAAAALGLSPWTSPVALWYSKVDPIKDDDDNEWFEWGRRLEIPISQAFAAKAGVQVTYLPQMLRSTLHPFMLANIDGFVGADAILEIKNVGQHNAHEWADGPPLHYRMQGQHYLAVTGKARVHFAALLGGQKMITYEVERDDELIENMIAGEEKFWTLVQLKRMPDIDGTESTTKALKAHFAEPEREIVEVDEAFVELVNEHRVAKTVLKIAETKVDEIENRMKMRIGDAEVAKFGDDIVATWKVQHRVAHEVKASTFRKLDVKRAKK